MSDSLLSQAEIDALLQKTPDVQETSVKTHSAAPPVSPQGGSPQRTMQGHPKLERILEIPLQVNVVLGETNKVVSDVISLAPGAIVEFNRAVSEPVDILVNGKLIARGEVVVVDEHFGIRITHILSPQDRVRRLA